MKSVLIAIATYNEADCISDLLESIQQILPDVSYLVVDDNSPDGTGELLASLKERFSTLEVIHRPRKMGIGSAHKLAMRYALSREFDFLVTMDADFSHNPDDLPKLLSLIEKNDFVIGSRYMSGGGCAYGPVRQIVSRSANLLTRLLLGVQLKETTTSFRGFSKSLLQRLPLDKIRADNYGFFIESTYLITRQTSRYCEFPIFFKDRRFGMTKISKYEILRAMFVLGRLFFTRMFGTSHSQEESSTDKNASIPCRICGGSYFDLLYNETLSTKNDAKDSLSTKVACTSIEHSTHGRIVKCLQCGIVFSNPQPDEKKLLDGYSDVVDETYAQNIHARVKTFTYNFESLKSFMPKEGLLLDVGCYCGVFLSVAKARGYKAFGVDPSRWAVDYAKDNFGVEAYQGTTEQMPPDYGEFDIVTAWDVLEHFSDPMKELAEIHRRMKSGGVLAFSTLNIESWFPKLLGERWPWLMDMHLFYFTDQIIEEMLQENGFQLIDTRTYCHIITFDYLLSKLSSLGIPGAKLLKEKVLPSNIRNFFMPFRFGDIRMYTCTKM